MDKTVLVNPDIRRCYSAVRVRRSVVHIEVQIIGIQAIRKFSGYAHGQTEAALLSKIHSHHIIGEMPVKVIPCPCGLCVLGRAGKVLALRGQRGAECNPYIDAAIGHTVGLYAQIHSRLRCGVCC